MALIDRWIAARFLANFALVFSVMFLFAVSIDVILQLDAYLEAAREAVDAGRFAAMWTAVPAAIVDYHAPRVFQFYAFMVGLCSVAAAGFTLTQMVRARELVAMLAAGLSLWRAGLVMLAVAVALNLVQLVNGEIVLPRLVAVRLTLDGENKLLLAQSFDPVTLEAENLLVIERDERGAAIRRIEAPRARWSEERGGWELEEGMAAGRSAPGSGEGREVRIDRSEPVAFVETDVSAKAILSRRFRGFAQLLSSPEIAALARDGGLDPADATRLVGQRFAGALVNLLMLVICLPFFLVREPRKMLQPSVLCAAVAVPGLLGALFLMTVKIGALPATLGVFLPVALLLPVAGWRVGALRT
ncbi:MAG: LptF/LptG family permease [Planctomycetaceae bacterium]|nr:LptF/LptG family permease [Planctomycetaceae bacterium]